MVPVVSKVYCSSSEVVLVVRRRPLVVNGGGLVATDSSQRVVFRVEGCGMLGRKGELILRDGNGAELLLIRQKGGIIQALSLHKKWRGYAFDYEGLIQKLVFSVREAANAAACFSRSNSIKVSVEQGKGGEFEIRGSFPDRDCVVVDNHGSIVAQIGVKDQVKMVMQSRDFYHVVIKPTVDQAFVFGVVAVLDYIYHESTRC